MFQDEQLQTLIRTALVQNDDVRIAAARVLQAQAVARHHPRRRLSERRRRTCRPAAAARRKADRQPARTAGAIRVGASLGWEIDFWGKYRRATEAARAQLLGAEWGRRAVATAIVSDVASGYFALRTSGSAAGDRPPDAGVAAGVAAS